MPSERKVPRLNRDIWERLVDGHGGNSAAAKIKMDQLLKKEADRLLIELEETCHPLEECLGSEKSANETQA
jgi:hypothetical protein